MLQCLTEVYGSNLVNTGDQFELLASVSVIAQTRDCDPDFNWIVIMYICHLISLVSAKNFLLLLILFVICIIDSYHFDHCLDFSLSFA